MKNDKSKLEEWIINLEKSQAKFREHRRHNNIELSGISSDIQENYLEKVVIGICHNSGLSQKISRVVNVSQSPETIGFLIKEKS